MLSLRLHTMSKRAPSSLAPPIIGGREQARQGTYYLTQCVILIRDALHPREHVAPGRGYKLYHEQDTVPCVPDEIFIFSLGPQYDPVLVGTHSQELAGTVWRGLIIVLLQVLQRRRI